MRNMHFKVMRCVIGGFSDKTFTDELEETILQDIAVHLPVSISGVEMHLAAWLDPEHWEDDWAEKLSVDPVDVPACVEGLMEQAIGS